MRENTVLASASERIAALLESLYGTQLGGHVAGQVGRVLDEFRPRLPLSAWPRGPLALTQRDALLITYGDMVREEGQPPLQTLAEFCEAHLRESVSGVHLLPHFPYTSDDGFAVTDYLAVNPALGIWDDVARFQRLFDLMFDAVFNHMSAQSEWFLEFLADVPSYQDFFVTVQGNPDLSRVVRPRALPLLTEFKSATGPRKVWTTFSADQVDLNFKNPNVLLATLRALLFYVEKGARFIRLDAVAYLWKDIGTPCIHLPQTHRVIEFWRAVLDEIAPHVLLITETNVPHRDNISYFGNGTNEAQLVYNFALPPLVLQALLRSDATHLTRWAQSLHLPSDQVAFFNFTASHDGIGLNPARGILPDSEIDFLVDRCLAHGGFINCKHNPDGSESPYEMNIVYFDAVNDPAAGESLETQVNRFIVSQAIMLALRGLPGIYFHSLFGSRSDREAALSSGINRRINRRKFLRAELEAELTENRSVRPGVFRRYRALLRARRNQPAFHPRGGQRVLTCDPRVFAVMRTSDGSEPVLCLHNVSNEWVGMSVTRDKFVPGGAWTDLLSEHVHRVAAGGTLTVTLRPYEVNWLKECSGDSAKTRSIRERP
jgi:sucrose phosphorylase